VSRHCSDYTFKPSSLPFFILYNLPTAQTDVSVRSALVLSAGQGDITATAANTIVLSAEDEDWSAGDTGSGFFVKPISKDLTGDFGDILAYDWTTGEIKYRPTTRRQLEPGLDARITELEARNVDLEAHNANLEGQIKALAETMEAQIKALTDKIEGLLS
jgi:hypothetical protein